MQKVDRSDCVHGKMSRIPNDEAVQLTNDDATECKQSAVQLGYWQDPYLFYFARSAERKPPEINRGYFARKRGIELLVEKFLKVRRLYRANRTFLDIKLKSVGK